jgi:predicted dehydrogenase
MIHLALVGCGGMAQSYHAPTLQQIDDCNVVALVDPAATARDRVREKFFPDAPTFASLDQLLEQPPARLDAVVLVTPHADHYPQSKAALERGLHVLVEKPMVVNFEHALDLWRTVDRTGKKLGITAQAPYSAPYQYLARERDAGRFGRVQMLHGWITQGWKAATAGKWRQIPTVSGGGMVYDTGAHLLNGILWLLDELPSDVYCAMDNCGTAVDINGVATFRFASGAMATVALGGNCPSWGAQLVVQTDRYRFEADTHGGKLEAFFDGKSVPVELPKDARPSAFTPHRNFIDALLGRAEIACPVRYGVMLSALMDAMYESARTGTAVKLKPLAAVPAAATP